MLIYVDIPESVQKEVQNAMRDPKMAAGLEKVLYVEMSLVEESAFKTPSPTPNIGVGQVIGRG